MYQIYNVELCQRRRASTHSILWQGCGDFARFASRQLVFNWSSWVQAQYPTADEASCCGRPGWTAKIPMAFVRPGESSVINEWRRWFHWLLDRYGIPSESFPSFWTLNNSSNFQTNMNEFRVWLAKVPYYMFGEVWAKWPLAKLVHPGWREAFRFFDTLGAALATLVRFFFFLRLCFDSNSTFVGFLLRFFWGEHFARRNTTWWLCGTNRVPWAGCGQRVGMLKNWCHDGSWVLSARGFALLMDLLVLTCQCLAGARCFESNMIPLRMLGRRFLSSEWIWMSGFGMCVKSVPLRTGLPGCGTQVKRSRIWLSKSCEFWDALLFLFEAK